MGFLDVTGVYHCSVSSLVTLFFFFFFCLPPSSSRLLAQRSVGPARPSPIRSSSEQEGQFPSSRPHALTPPTSPSATPKHNAQDDKQRPCLPPLPPPPRLHLDPPNPLHLRQHGLEQRAATDRRLEGGIRRGTEGGTIGSRGWPWTKGGRARRPSYVCVAHGGRRGGGGAPWA